MSQQKPSNDTNNNCFHTKNASYHDVPNYPLAAFPNHRSNISEIPKYSKFPLDSQKPKRKEVFTQKKYKLSKADEEQTLNSYTIEKRIPEDEKYECSDPLQFPYFSNNTEDHCLCETD
mmetsp:Transcript_7402/g.6559  ORF Transcript_7402/g.6559 Transcript_7402/m.6559 type:complete len:118 (+) Transcript_7402:384-737(+)